MRRPRPPLQGRPGDDAPVAEKAAEIFRQLVQFQPDETNHRQHLAAALKAAGRHQEALRQYLELVRRDPKPWRWYEQIADAYIELGQYELAAAACTRALQGEDRASAGTDMIDFVIAIADYARETRGVSDFLVFPQNGEAILDEEGVEDYLDAVNGIGIEDLYFSSDVENNGDLAPDHTDEVVPYLEQFTDAGKIVLVIDYVQDDDKVSTLYEEARDAGFIPYASIRDLDELTVNAGFDP